MGWYWLSWLLGPLLLMSEGAEVVVMLYVCFGLAGLMLMGAIGLQRHGVKFCPACKAGNPIDADLCQRCGTVPAAREG